MKQRTKASVTPYKRFLIWNSLQLSHYSTKFKDSSLFINKEAKWIYCWSLASCNSEGRSSSLKEMKLVIVLIMVFLMDTWIQADGYDPLDPAGNIRVTFDIKQWTHEGYVAKVTIQNLYQYRHVEKPGWSLQWNWTRGEVIWSMAGAVATHQGNCSNFKFRTPHSCRPDPHIVDLTLQAPAENRTDNCCHGGLLAASAIDPPNSITSFVIEVGNLGRAVAYLPTNLTLMAPDMGYTCSPLEDVSPTVFMVVEGKREEQVFSKIPLPEIPKHICLANLAP